MPTDLILTNAKVITMNTALPSAGMVAVDGDTIFSVGSSDAAARMTGKNTKVIDCGGRTVMPGFNDAHVHLFSFIKKLLSVDVSPAAVKSIAEIKKVIRDKAAKTQPGTWISGTDYNEFYLAEKHCPTRYDLDEAAPDHPVILSHRSLHACVLNSKGLELAGINNETPEPPGARIERDLETGEPNGILIDMLGHIRSNVMPRMSQEELWEGAALADTWFLSHGVTSFQEATVSNDLTRWEAVCDLKLDADLLSRITMMAGAPFYKDFSARGLKTGAGDNLMQLGAVKFVPEVQPGQEELNKQVIECHKAGWQMSFHAIAESTINAVITALEYAAKQSPTAGRRHRIEHCGECPPALMERIKKLGAMIITHPSALYYQGERYLATVEKSQLPWLYRIKSPIAAGIKVAAASDAPVAPPDPFAGIYGAVTRQAASGQVLQPEERISVQQALELYTANAAYASFEEKIKGILAPGMLADMIILSDDPMTVPPEKLKDIKVEMTVIGGEVVWEG
jgi:predicted amidohydrolase YtcJ